MSRLEGPEASKLSRRAEGAAAGPEGLQRLSGGRREIKRSKSFRLHPRDIGRLEALVERVGDATGRRVSASVLVSGALMLAEKAEVGDVIEAIKDAAWSWE